MKPLKAEDVKLANMIADRPGIIKPFMLPAKLKNQVRINAGKTDLKFEPVGKTLVGGTQWAIKLARPGIAEPLIIARNEQKAMQNVAKAMEKEMRAEAKVAAAAVAVENAKK